MFCFGEESASKGDFFTKLVDMVLKIALHIPPTKYLFLHQYVLLTSACWVHSNVYGLRNIHCIRYVTAIDPIHSTSYALHKYHHLTSGSVEVPVCPFTMSINPGFVGEKPIPHVRAHFTSVRTSAASSLVGYAEQGIITFTNVLQGHKTVVLVYFTSQWEPDITFTLKQEIQLSL